MALSISLPLGHCALSGSNNWYHAGWGLLGTEAQSLFSSGYDAIRIGFSRFAGPARITRTTSPYGCS